jgi:hypothetical protein
MIDFWDNKFLNSCWVFGGSDWLSQTEAQHEIASTQWASTWTVTSFNMGALTLRPVWPNWQVDAIYHACWVNIKSKKKGSRDGSRKTMCFRVHIHSIGWPDFIKIIKMTAYWNFAFLRPLVIRSFLKIVIFEKYRIGLGLHKQANGLNRVGLVQPLTSAVVP